MAFWRFYDTKIGPLFVGFQQKAVPPPRPIIHEPRPAARKPSPSHSRSRVARILTPRATAPSAARPLSPRPPHVRSRKPSPSHSRSRVARILTPRATAPSAARPLSPVRPTSDRAARPLPPPPPPHQAPPRRTFARGPARLSPARLRCAPPRKALVDATAVFLYPWQEQR